MDIIAATIEKVRRLDSAAGFDPARGDPVEVQTAHLTEEQRSAWRALRSRIDRQHLTGAEADAAIAAMEAQLGGAN